MTLRLPLRKKPTKGLGERTKGRDNPKITPRCQEVISELKGVDLKAHRRSQKINQTEMGGLIGCSRHAVSYWETKALISARQLRYGVPKAMCEVLGIEVLPNYYPNMRARGDGVLDGQQRLWDKESARQSAKAEAKMSRYRQPCGAQTRKGHPCRNLSEPGRRRCKFHGGKSTGPRTKEGKVRIAEAQRKRWAEVRKLAESDGGA